MLQDIRTTQHLVFSSLPSWICPYMSTAHVHGVTTGRKGIRKKTTQPTLRRGGECNNNMTLSERQMIEQVKKWPQKTCQGLNSFCSSNEKSYFPCVHFHVWYLVMFLGQKSLIISCAGLLSARLHDETERKHLLAASRSQYAWKFFEECEIQDKINVSLSLSVSLALRLQLLHICLLLFASFPPPHGHWFSSGREETDVKTPRGGSVLVRVSSTSLPSVTLTSRRHQPPALPRMRGLGQTPPPPHASVSQVNDGTTDECPRSSLPRSEETLSLDKVVNSACIWKVYLKWYFLQDAEKISYNGKNNCLNELRNSQTFLGFLFSGYIYVNLCI